MDDLSYRYTQPFDKQPQRLLWWVDDVFHRRAPMWLFRLWRPVCDWLDRQIWP